MPRKFRYTHSKYYVKNRKKGRPSPPSSPCKLAELHTSIELSPGWVNQTSNPENEIQLCRISRSPGSSKQPMVVSHCLCINSDLTWIAHVHGHNVSVANTVDSPLSSIPCKLDPKSLTSLFQIMDKCTVCPGNPEQRFLEMADSRKGSFKASDGSITAQVDDSFVVCLNGKTFNRTIRCSTCSVLCKGDKCESCKLFRPKLRAMQSRWSKQTRSPKKFVNNRYLNTPQKAKKLASLQKRAYAAECEVRKLKERISISSDSNGLNVDTNLHGDLQNIMEENNERILGQFPEGSFQRLFWEQQLSASRLKRPQQMRWHPAMIRWCLNIKLLSTSAYHALRTSGFMKLPSERTLRDYTHYIKARSGFQGDVDQELVKEAKLNELPDRKKHIVLLLDEMKVKENLVYDKHETNVIGFVDIADVNNEIAELENECSSSNFGPLKAVATHMLVLMVRGIFIKLEFPYAHFPSKDLTGEHLFSILWEAIERLEKLGFKVMVITADGASCNRKFFRMHGDGSEVCYKTKNPYTSEDRSIFFVSDPPHLIKTTRNCWSHSHAHGNTRDLWINGQTIRWQHLSNLYEAKLATARFSQGLYLLPKLSIEHIQLSSYSRMRVDLAAQALSESVANALAFYDDLQTRETQRFVRIFDKFFDCLNVRNLDEHRKRRKPNLKPYCSKDDERLKWLEKDFLGYLEEWQLSVDSRQDIADGKKATMTLSKETLEGLTMTVRSFVELTRYLTTLPDAMGLYFLSERISQDPLENYFGRVRARGGRCENPSAKDCLVSAQSLRVQGSFAMQPIRGNSSRKKRLFPEGCDVTVDNTPLSKRPRNSKKSC